MVTGLHNTEMNIVDCRLTGKLLKVHEVYWSQLLHQVWNKSYYILNAVKRLSVTHIPVLSLNMRLEPGERTI